MSKVLSASRLPGLVAVGVVLFGFWPALFGGASFVATDIVLEHSAPYDAYLPGDFTLETDSTDPINIHAHWASLASDVRSGDVGWWNSDLAGGQPTMKGGLPIFNLGYLVAPDWFAPGLVAAIRTLTAIGLTYGLIRSWGLLPVSALVGGIAFAFCGFMLTWMNWPHSSTAALMPGLVWALERLIRDPRLWRAVPLGGVAAAMAWTNFPQVTLYALLGAAIYVAIRLPVEFRLRTGAPPDGAPQGHVPDGDGFRLTAVVTAGLLAIVLAVLLAAPHLIGFAQYLDWGDTNYRNWSSMDSSAGVRYLLTAVAPAIWGHGSFGPLWFGEAGWNEPHAYVGASVLMLALLGFVSGVRHTDQRRRSVLLAISAIAGIGVLIAYIGGPLTVPLRALAGDQIGAMTRAKVLWNLGIALGAAFGVERLATSRSSGSSWSLSRSVGVASLVGLALAIAMIPSGIVWFEAVTAEDVLREVLALSVVPALSAVAVAAIVLARIRGWLTVEATSWALAGVVGFEMLSFMMPVHTFAEPDERLTATPAHAAVTELLDPGERLSGEGFTFFPSTSSLFDIDDARGHVIKSPAYNALFRAVTPDALTLGKGHATPTWPYIPFDADISSTVWDAMAVGVWAQFPDSRPPGTVIAPAPAPAPAQAAEGSDPATEPHRTTLSSPVGGLRAVLIDVASSVGGDIDVRIGAAGQRSTERRRIVPQYSGQQSFAFPGEDLQVGTPVSIEVTSPSPKGALLVAVDASSELVAGMVAGDDDLRLAHTGDVLLIERPNATFVRLADAAVVEPEPQRAAEAVAARDVGERTVVIDTDLRFPEVPAQGAELEVVSVSLSRDRIDTVVRVDRAAIVMISVSDYPGWSATVDGRAAEIVTADAAFMGVAVPEGEHLVTLKFRPRHLGISLLLATFGIVLAAGLLVAGGFRQHRRTSPSDSVPR